MMTIRKLEPKGNWKYRWEAPSSSNPDVTYVVAMSEEGQWACGCIGWTRHVPRKDCKHILDVKRMEPVDTEGMTRLRQARAARPARTQPTVQPVPAPARARKAAPVPAPEPEPFLVIQTKRLIRIA